MLKRETPTGSRPIAFASTVHDQATAASADLSKAIDLASDFGEAYCSRYVVDTYLQDDAQAQYDQRKGQLLDPERLAAVQNNIDAANGRKAALQERKDRDTLMALEAAMALTAAMPGLTR